MSKQPPLRGDRTYRNEVLRIAELTVNTSTLEGLTFQNCRLIGPAILAVLNNVDIIDCTWNAPGPDAVFWEVAEGRQVVGAVGVVECTFSNCTFDGIGLAGTPETKKLFETAFRTE